MIKNIAVIDEQGNRYEATYPKRAKGLVKNGRARFVDEKTICLACPPYKSEDKIMSENMGSKGYSLENLDVLENLSVLEKLSVEKDSSEDLSAVEEIKKRAVDYLDSVQQENAEERGEQLQNKPLSREIVEKVLDQLDHFAADDAYISILAEKHFDSEDMTNIVGLREATRQRQLEVYRTVLEKAIASEVNARVNALQQLERVTDWISGLDRDDFDGDMWEMIRTKAFELMSRFTAVV